MENRILIDLSVVDENCRGMGFFTKRIVCELLESDSEVTYYFVSNNAIDQDLQKRINLSRHKLVFCRWQFPLFLNFWIPYYCLIKKIDACWFSYNLCPFFKFSRVKYILTVHDTIFLKKFKSHTLRQFIGKFYRKINLYLSRYVVDSYTSVSEYSLLSVLQYVDRKVDNLRDYILFSGVGNCFIFDDDVLLKYNVSYNSYIYTISGDADHKNFSFLLNAFHLALSEFPDIKLVVSGFKSKPFSNQNVLFTDRITDAEKNSLIKNSLFFAFISSDEGFGLPLIEAMCFTNKIIATDIPVFREVAADRVFYISDNDVDFIKAFLKKNDFINNEKLILSNKNYVLSRFSPEKTSNKLLYILQK